MTKRWGPIVQMAVLGTLCLAGAVGLSGPSAYREAALGVAGPLVGSAGSWLLMVRAADGGQARLMAFMTKAMAAKMVLFPLYVVGLVLIAGLRPVPFAAAFTSAFVALYAVQALHLKRLVAVDLSRMGVPGQQA